MKQLYKKYKLIVHAFILMLAPILCVLMRTLLVGQPLSTIWLGASQWNDELFYYKQVECMVNNGYPMGFFGYNESAAGTLSFGAWSPVILLPWALFGKIFGWSSLTPFIANLVYICIAMFLLGIFAKPTIEKTLIITFSFLLITPMSRYILSCMPEVVIISLLIVLVSMIAGFNESRHKKGRTITMLVLVFILTLMRPYFVMFFIFPFIVGNRREKTHRVASVIVAIASVLGYAVISKRFIAPYFTDVYSTGFLDVLAKEGFLPFVKYVFGLFTDNSLLFIKAAAGGLKSGYPIGIYAFAFLFILLLLFVEGIWLNIKKKHGASEMLCMAICMIGMYLAIVLMYSLTDGFRHLLSFVIAGFLLAVLSKPKYYINEALCAVLFIWLFLTRAKDPLYFDVPTDSESIDAPKQKVMEMKEELTEDMDLSLDKLSWDNDMVLVMTDTCDEKEGEVLTAWQYAYGTPKGCAISLCTNLYVKENLGNLKSKYIMVMRGGEIEERLFNNGSQMLSENDKISVWKLR